MAEWLPPSRHGGLFTRADSQGKTGWTLSLESGRTHRTFPASSCHEGKIAQNPEAAAHLRALAGLPTGLIPADATNILAQFPDHRIMMMGPRHSDEAQQA